MEKIRWTDRVRSGEIWHVVKEDRNNLRAIKWRKADWIGHILHRNCLLKHVIEGNKEERIDGGRGRRRRQLLGDLRKTRGFKEEALDRFLSWTRFGWGHRLIVRQDYMKVYFMGLKSGISGPREGHWAGILSKRFWEYLCLRNNRIMQTITKCGCILYFYWIF